MITNKTFIIFKKIPDVFFVKLLSDQLNIAINTSFYYSEIQK